VTLFGFVLKAVITEKTIKEEWIDKNYSNDNYNYNSAEDTIEE
jgi:hypothetical protein